MVYYFSGTGNSKWVAEEIAAGIGTKAVNIVDVTEDVKVQKGEVVGFVCPIYAWSIAESMSKFLNRVKMEEGAFSFLVVTCGEEAGNGCRKAQEKFSINSCYSLAMPNNYILGADVDQEEEIIKKVAVAKQAILKICEEVKENKAVIRVNKGSLAGLKTSVVSPLFNKFARNTKPFYAEESCTSCGLCESKCPTHTIHLVNGKPEWGTECMQCLACINHCPAQAIQYGKNTKDRGRYYFTPKYVK